MGPYFEKGGMRLYDILRLTDLGMSFTIHGLGQKGSDAPTPSKGQVINYGGGGGATNWGN